MIQEIFPHVFSNAFVSRDTAQDDILFVFQQDTVLLKVVDNQLYLPTVRELNVDTSLCRSLFPIDNQWYSMLKDGSMEPPVGYAYYNKHQYRNFRPMDTLFAVSVASSLNRWYSSNRFCGRCGSPMEDSTTERALVCPQCGKVLHPKICPAVIAGIRNGNKILLTRYTGKASKRVALVAGYNEIGESIEQTLHREVMEEVGLRVKNLQFYKSQPWVLTDSLMIGFFCDLDGEDTITLQESELSMGTWVAREDLPEDTTHLSLTAEMIEQFRLGRA